MMPEPFDGLCVYTIGHGTLPVPKFLELLTANEIQTLVDVRSVPYSRFAPDYNQNNLQHTLQVVRISYKFAGEYLGGRPKDPTCYRTGQVLQGQVDKSKYLSVVDYQIVETKPFYQIGIERLLTYAGAARTAIMCSEEDPDHCHRKRLIAQTLAKKNIAVIHIYKDGATQFVHPNDGVEPQQLSLFGLLDTPANVSPDSTD